MKPKSTRGKPALGRLARKPLPAWVGLVVVIATAFATGWGMLRTARGRGWTAGADGSYLPLDATRVASPTLAAAQSGGIAVAGVPQAINPTTAPPPIIAGTAAHHEDRGACTGCHVVLTVAGQSIPGISVFAALAHDYRGVCTMCHGIVATGSPPTVAGQAQAPAGQQVAWPQCPAAAQGLPYPYPGGGPGRQGGPVRQF